MSKLLISNSESNNQKITIGSHLCDIFFVESEHPNFFKHV